MRLEYRIGYSFEDRFTAKYRAFQNAFTRGLSEIQSGFRSIDREFGRTLANLEVKAKDFRIKPRIEEPKIEELPKIAQEIEWKVEPFKAEIPPKLTQEIEQSLRPAEIKPPPKFIQEIEQKIKPVDLEVPRRITQEIEQSLRPAETAIPPKLTQEIEHKPVVFKTPYLTQSVKLQTDTEPLTKSIGAAFYKVNDLWEKDFVKSYKEVARDMKRRPLEVPAKLDIDERDLQGKGSFNLTIFPVISDAKQVAEEEAVTLTEALYEGVRYGLRKGELAKAFMEEINRAKGYIGTEELAQAFVDLAEMGVRGTEKEMARFASMVVEVSKATKLSSEGVAKLTYEMQGLGLEMEGMKRVFAYAGGAIEKYNIPQDKLIENLEAFKRTAGSVFATWDRQVKEKVLKGVVDLSGKLESLYLDSSAFIEQVGNLMTGQYSQAQGLINILSRAGYSYRDFVRAMKSGDVQTAQKMMMEGLLKIREQLLSMPEEVRGAFISQYSEMLGISEDTLTQLVSKTPEEIRKVFSESISPVDIQKRLEETTNVITRWTNILKNKVVGGLGAEFADVIGEGIDVLTSTAGVVAPFLLFKAGPAVLDKLKDVISGGFPKPSLPKFSLPGTRAVAEGIKEIGEVSKVSKVGMFTSSIGKVLPKVAKFGAVLSVVGAGLEFMQAKTAKEKAEAVGGGVGGLGGALAGAAIGSAILPGIGTVIGGIIGGLGGNLIGRKVANIAGGLLGIGETQPKEITPVEVVGKEREVYREKETVKEEGKPPEELAILNLIAQKLDVLGEIRDLINAYMIAQKLKPVIQVSTGMEGWTDKGFRR